MKKRAPRIRNNICTAYNVKCMMHEIGVHCSMNTGNVTCTQLSKLEAGNVDVTWMIRRTWRDEIQMCPNRLVFYTAMCKTKMSAFYSHITSLFLYTTVSFQINNSYVIQHVISK
jgi:hypothetical protein